ncbi:MAG: hypothetical protein HRF43_18445 [Phycisphaerae bacterium]|jgi:alpha-N-arabinofuranosidase
MKTILNDRLALGTCVILALTAPPFAGGSPVQGAEPASAPAGGSVPAEVKLRVRADKPAGPPITRYITGKFVEHLGSNIYNGMCAQIVRNPTFGDYAFWTGGQTPDGRMRLIESESAILDHARRDGRRLDWPRDQVERLAESRQDALAHGWVKVGPRAAVRTSPDTGPHGGRAQRVEVAAAGQGIAQYLHLPLHRVRQYRYEAVIRSPDGGRLEVALSPAGAPEQAATSRTRELSAAWGLHQGLLNVDKAAPADEIYRLSITAERPGQFVIAQMFLWPMDAIDGADPDVVRLLRESRVPVLRWPGGNFVSAYHWRDGIGLPVTRPTRHNPAWGGVEPNLFGTDEFMAFCKAVGAEPFICVNAGDGTPEEAAAWVEYCNGPPDSRMGALRAANHHPEPYNVRLWEIGNELWGRWQVHWTTPRGYADRYRQFAAAMRKADPTITLYACGAPVLWGKEWNETLIREAGDVLQRTTDHPLIGGNVPASVEPLDVYRNFMAVPDILEKEWAALHGDMLAAGIRDPKLGITELQMFARLEGGGAGGAAAKLNPFNLVGNATLTEALYDTLMYHAAVRLAPFVDLVTHSATVNHGGGLRKERERVYANPCHYAQSAFAAFAGAVPVEVELTGAPAETAPTVLPDLKGKGGRVDYAGVAALAALSADGAMLISLVHRGTAGPAVVAVELMDFAAGDRAEVWTLSADVPWAANSLRDPEAVRPATSEAAVARNVLTVTLRPFSVARVRVPRR